MVRKSRVLDRQSYAAEEILFREGEQGGRAFFIEKGRVEVFRTDDAGNEISISELGENEIVGEMAVLTGGRRSASVRILEPSILVSITGQDFNKKLQETDKVFRALLEMYISRIKRVNTLLFEKSMNLVEFEESLNTLVKNISKMVDPAKREDFRMEVKPVLDELHGILKKYENETGSYV